MVTDLLTISALVALEGLLSADNALVMAVMVLGLPRHQRRPALFSGLAVGFALRFVATLFAIHLIRIAWIKVAGGFYLFYLVYAHFWGHQERADRRLAPNAKPWLGLSAFWATVLRVELVNLAFSIDSILVAVAMSPKQWVVMTGSLLGIVALRLVVGPLITLVERYPALVDGAFMIVAWIGAKLCADWLHSAGYVAFEIPQWSSLIVVVGIFLSALVYARMRGPVDPGDVDTLRQEAEEVLQEEALLGQRKGRG